MARERMDIALKRTVTHEFRLSYPSLIKAKAFDETQEAKYSVVALFPKETNLGAPANGQEYSLKRIVNNAKIEMWGENKAKWPKNMRSPFRDGDELPDDHSNKETYSGHIYVTLSNKKPPGLVDQRLKPILDEQTLYPGCWARAEVIAFPYSTKGNNGVSLSLQNLQKTRDDDSFSSKKAAHDVFDRIEAEDSDDGSDDEESYGDEDEDTKPAPKKSAKKKTSKRAADEDDEY